MHAVVVGSDMNAQTRLEAELRKFVIEKRIQDRVHFVNKTLAVAPYLAAIDVLVQNSQVTYTVFEFQFQFSRCCSKLSLVVQFSMRIIGF